MRTRFADAAQHADAFFVNRAISSADEKIIAPSASILAPIVEKDFNTGTNIFIKNYGNKEIGCNRIILM